MVRQVTAPPAFRRAEPDVRRRSLIEACARVLAREGASGASVRVIAAEAGVSPALIGHYFTGIDALIAATYADIGERVSAALDAAVEAAGPTPRARLRAYVTANFLPPIADPQLLATWTAFWGLVGTKPEIARQHAAQYAGFRGRLESLLGDGGVALGERRRTAIAVTALIDGLWLELCLSPETFAPGEAEAIALDALVALTWSAWRSV